MAMGLLRAQTAQTEPDQDWRVESAGTWALDGVSAARRTQAVMKERGIDVSTHRSRQITREMLEVFDVVLTMESSHKEALQAEFPDLRHKVLMFSELVGQRFDIPDPINGSHSDFEDTARELEGLLKSGWNKLHELACLENPPSPTTSH